MIVVFLITLSILRVIQSQITEVDMYLTVGQVQIFFNFHSLTNSFRYL